MNFDLLTKDDLFKISQKLNNKIYEKTYVMKLYGFSEEEVENIKMIAITDFEKNLNEIRN